MIKLTKSVLSYGNILLTRLIIILYMRNLFYLFKKNINFGDKAKQMADVLQKNGYNEESNNVLSFIWLFFSSSINNYFLFKKKKVK